MTRMTLTEFLLARLDEDEAAAFGKSTGEGYVLRAADGRTVTTVGGDRLRAEVAAKRAIIGLHDETHDCQSSGGWDSPYTGCGELRLLALPYATHPDYRTAWSLDDASRPPVSG